MGNTLMSLLVKLGLDTTDFDKGTDRAKEKAAGLQNGLAIIGGGIVGGGIAAVGTGLFAMTKFLADGAKGAAESASVQAQLAAVLESTGGAAGVTAQKVNELAQAAMSTTKFDDDMVVSGENMLLTFTNIGKDTFPAATTAMLDLSQAMGQDMKSSAIQLGKALNDPTTGLTALQRVGVTFSDQQKKQVESMMKAGKVAEAQKIILAELNKEFGGSAARAGATFEGTMTIMQNKLDDVGKSIGGALLPIVNELANGFIDFLANPAIQTGIALLTDSINTFADAFSSSLGDGNDVLTSIANGFLSLYQISPVFQFIGDSIFQMMDIFDNLKTAMQNDQGIIVGVLAALGVAVAFFTFSVVVPAIASVIVALAPAILVMALVAGAAYLLYTAWTTNFGGIRDILTAVWYGTLLPALTQLWTWLQVTIPIALAWLSATWTTIWATIQDVFKVFVAAIKGIYDLFQLAFTGQWVKLGEELRVICDNAWKILKALWAEFKLWFEKTTDTMIQNVKNFFTNTNWGQVGQDIVHGIANGITAGASWVMDAINKVIADAMAVISGFTGKVASGAASVTVAPGSTPYPARAGGGSVSANVPYLVGENGPELFVPGANGDIVSNGQMGNTYILNVYTSQSPDVVTQSFGMMKALAGG